jgi:hypothetical protein
MPADSWLADQNVGHGAPQTAEQIATGRQLGSEIAAELVKEIRGMGMPAEYAWKGATPQVNDIVIHGYLLSVKEGDAAKRVSVGLGAGASELRTAVEGFQMTPQGLRKLGSGTLESGSGKTPGAAVGLATLLATHNPAGLIVSTGVKVYGEKSKVRLRLGQTDRHEIGDTSKAIPTGGPDQLNGGLTAAFEFARSIRQLGYFCFMSIMAGRTRREKS